ncbi:PstS family phosphate ABC transporter substrate-binding protein [Natronocalculus amylovorans]|uniref:PstS family phosphate ABC transporter substrate-binding protein n=1 Tax=Natronocalculus amylovorans TaxID=2917812 RepID=A0AAE3K9U2_9EURY|nr:PstS family phosphate ABC transporter substrate-binding protein [Natronocalculus amylovorans]MCL9816404.1 PstS family phosphate ABC transporter substrate-binding protein [Natronocalculus amylovorans]NUE03496.1 PstS family phosphate ABC transporter substrate-binding protein [Halorubraceae archaeon YAN]
MDIEQSRDDNSSSRSRRQFLLAAGGSLTAGLAGCLVRGDETDLEGEIRVDGSNTVLPHAAALAEEFQWRNNRVRIPVRGSGTGAGFQRFASGETHIQNASREITDDEQALCEQNGVEFIELEAVLDGIAIWVHPDNDWCDCLTVEQLQAIWEPNSEVETWHDVDDEWPDEEIRLYGRDSASGTFDYFTEAINGSYGAIRSDYSGTPDTNVIVRGVRGNEYAMGFGGAGYYYENEDELKLVGIDDGDGCIEPTRETIESGEYTPLSRPMFAYVNTNELERTEFREYLRFFFAEVDDRADRSVVEDGEELTWTQWAARRVGFYAIPDLTVDESRESLEDTISRIQ